MSKTKTHEIKKTAWSNLMVIGILSVELQNRYHRQNVGLCILATDKLLGGR